MLISVSSSKMEDIELLKVEVFLSFLSFKLRFENYVSIS